MQYQLILFLVNISLLAIVYFLMKNNPRQRKLVFLTTIYAYFLSVLLPYLLLWIPPKWIIVSYATAIGVALLVIDMLLSEGEESDNPDHNEKPDEELSPNMVGSADQLEILNTVSAKNKIKLKDTVEEQKSNIESSEIIAAVSEVGSGETSPYAPEAVLGPAKIDLDTAADDLAVDCVLSNDEGPAAAETAAAREGENIGDLEIPGHINMSPGSTGSAPQTDAGDVVVEPAVTVAREESIAELETRIAAVQAEDRIEEPSTIEDIEIIDLEIPDDASSNLIDSVKSAGVEAAAGDEPEETVAVEELPVEPQAADEAEIDIKIEESSAVELEPAVQADWSGKPVSSDDPDSEELPVSTESDAGQDQDENAETETFIAQVEKAAAPDEGSVQPDDPFITGQAPVEMGAEYEPEEPVAADQSEEFEALSIDQLIELAFEAKFKDDYARAIQIFEQVLTLKPPVSVVSLILEDIEIMRIKLI